MQRAHHLYSRYMLPCVVASLKGCRPEPPTLVFSKPASLSKPFMQRALPNKRFPNEMQPQAPSGQCVASHKQCPTECLSQHKALVKCTVWPSVTGLSATNRAFCFLKLQLSHWPSLMSSTLLTISKHLATLHLRPQGKSI